MTFNDAVALAASALTFTGAGNVAVAGAISGSGSAIRNFSGNNTLGGQLSLGGATTMASDSGTLTLTGDLNIGSQPLTFSGAGDITATGSINGNAIVKSGSCRQVGFSRTLCRKRKPQKGPEALTTILQDTADFSFADCGLNRYRSDVDLDKSVY